MHDTARPREDGRLGDVLAHLDAGLDAGLARLFALLRIPSVSTEAAHAADCRAAADWLASDLRAIGFEAAVHATPGHPVVLGHARTGDRPSALFYGHYDVQPVDPLDLWTTPPFEPRLDVAPDGTRVIRARGAADDKGQVMTFLEACRAWKAVAGVLPIDVTVLIEGEEEASGENLPPFLRAHADALRADVALVCDTDLWDAATPAITTSLRGICAEEVVIHGADRDLHSGGYGSAAANPNRVLARILADLHDDHGRVTLPGFYDGVPEVSDLLRDQWAALDFDPAKFLGGVGLSLPAGERDRSVLEMLWSRPTAEINGMAGGYSGPGFKTVIPAEARAKISFRLVADQDPHAVRAAFRRFVRARTPADCRVSFHDHGSSRAVAFAPEAPAFAKARAALADEWGRAPVLVGTGGSIPICRDIRDALGMDVILAGWGREDDRVHSPDEKYDLESYRKGARAWARILAALAD